VNQDRLAEWFHLDGTVCVAGHHAETAFCVEGHGPVMVRPVCAEVARLRDLLARLDTALDRRLAGLEREPLLPYWAGVAAAYADARKLLRDPDWLAAALHPERKEAPSLS